MQCNCTKPLLPQTPGEVYTVVLWKFRMNNCRNDNIIGLRVLMKSDIIGWPIAMWLNKIKLISKLLISIEYTQQHTLSGLIYNIIILSTKNK